jgi:uncharacterized protein YlzI (FlbEa/FlbD family)
MLEFSSLEGLPVFVESTSIELIEQQEDGTCLCLKSGRIQFVLENASEIMFEIKAYNQFNLLEQAGMA